MLGLDTTRDYRVARDTALCCLITRLRAMTSRVIYRSSTDAITHYFLIDILMKSGIL